MIATAADVEIKECENTNIYLFHEFLNEKQCKRLINEFDKLEKFQMIMKLPEVSKALWSYVGNKISSQVFEDKRNGKRFRVTAIKDQITITKSKVRFYRHRDNKMYGTDFKLAFYLNDMSSGGGTNFFENGEVKVEVQNKAGNGILFDMILEHEGQLFPKEEKKYMIGARPIIQYL